LRETHGRKEVPMKKLLVLAVVLAGLWFFGKPLLEKSKSLVGVKSETYEDKARARVEAILAGWKTGGGGSGTDIQTSICYWARGVPLITDQAELGRYSDQFDAFCQRKNLFRRIADYEITEVAVVPGAPLPTAEVTCKIEGGFYKMKVTEGQPISWAD
jgi:hypothetical protein